MAKILLVDDEIEICDLLSESLKELGYEIETAHSGKEGYEKAVATPYDLMILDIYLPDEDGVVVYDKLRQTAIHEKTPVIFLTALAQGVKPQLKGQTHADYTILSKPSTIDKIHEEIQRLLKTGSQE